MAEENTNTPPEIIQAKKKSSMFNPKIFLIGLPIFIVQLVAVYFITANILLAGEQTVTQKETGTTEITNEKSAKDKSDIKGNRSTENTKVGLIYSVDDMIVNPAQTNGKMLLLASLGLSVENEEARKSLEEKQVIVKDAIISVLSSKNVNQLSSADYRDTLKTEILKNLAEQMPGSKVNNIYFSKFIIQ